MWSRDGIDGNGCPPSSLLILSRARSRRRSRTLDRINRPEAIAVRCDQCLALPLGSFSLE